MLRTLRAVGLFTATLFAAMLCPLDLPPLQAQQKGAPTVPATFPNLTSNANIGTQRGKTVELTLTGTNLLEATGVWLSFPGKVTIDEGQKDATKLKVKIDVPAATPIGVHSIRVATKAGVSNLRPFIVDELPEIAKKDGNDSREKALVVPTPCVVLGTVAAEKSDYYKFAVKAGETITIEALGRRLGSPIDPVIIFYDGKGQETAGLYADDTPGLQTDARVSYKSPSNSELIVEIRDTTFRGGAEYGYRLRIGNFPSATAANPLFVQAGKKTDVRFTGPDAANDKPVSVTANAIDSVLYVSAKGASGISGWPVPVQVSSIPESSEQEPNNEPSKANLLPVPGGVTAVFAEKNDIDHFRFQATKGKKLIVQALTFEVNAPTEVYMRILDAKGSEIAKSNPQQPTPRIEFTPPADGEFVVACEQTNFISGPNEVYHLSIRPVEPDFTITVGLDRVEAPLGTVGQVPIIGLAKLNGFNSPIELTWEGSEGASGKVTLPAGANPQPNAPIYLPIELKAGAKLGPIVGRVKAVAKVDKIEIVNYGSTFDIVKAALGNMPNPPLEMTTQIAIAITPEPLFTITLKLDSTEVTKGGTLKGKIIAKRTDKFDEEIVISAASLPAAVVPTFKPIPKAAQEAEISFSVPAGTPAGPGVIALRGTAKVNKKDVVVMALPITINVKDAPKKK